MKRRHLFMDKFNRSKEIFLSGLTLNFESADVNYVLEELCNFFNVNKEKDFDKMNLFLNYLNKEKVMKEYFFIHDNVNYDFNPKDIIKEEFENFMVKLKDDSRDIEDKLNRYVKKKYILADKNNNVVDYYLRNYLRGNLKAAKNIEKHMENIDNFMIKEVGEYNFVKAKYAENYYIQKLNEIGIKDKKAVVLLDTLKNNDILLSLDDEEIKTLSKSKEVNAEYLRTLIYEAKDLNVSERTIAKYLKISDIQKEDFNEEVYLYVQTLIEDHGIKEKFLTKNERLLSIINKGKLYKIDDENRETKLINLDKENIDDERYRKLSLFHYGYSDCIKNIEKKNNFHYNEDVIDRKYYEKKMNEITLGKSLDKLKEEYGLDKDDIKKSIDCFEYLIEKEIEKQEEFENIAII